MNRLTVGLLATFVALLLGSGLLAYVLRDRTAPVNASAASSAPPISTSTPPAPEHRPLLWQLFGSDSSTSSPTTVASWESIACQDRAAIFTGSVSGGAARLSSAARRFGQPP